MVKYPGFNCFFSIFLVNVTRKSLVGKVKWALTYLTQQTGRIPMAISWKSKRKQLLHIYEEKQTPVWLAIVFHGLLLYFVITACPYLLVAIGQPALDCPCSPPDCPRNGLLEQGLPCVTLAKKVTSHCQQPDQHILERTSFKPQAGQVWSQFSVT